MTRSCKNNIVDIGQVVLWSGEDRKRIDNAQDAEDQQDEAYDKAHDLNAAWILLDVGLTRERHLEGQVHFLWYIKSCHQMTKPDMLHPALISKNPVLAFSEATWAPCCAACCAAAVAICRCSSAAGSLEGWPYICGWALAMASRMEANGRSWRTQKARKVRSDLIGVEGFLLRHFRDHL